MTAGPLLVFDALGASLRAEVFFGDASQGAAEEILERGRSDRIVAVIGDAARAARIDLREIAAVATLRGPGGFTGVRVAVATARALSLACGRPAIGVDLFEALSVDAPPPSEGGLAVVAAAGRSGLLRRHLWENARWTPAEADWSGPWADVPIRAGDAVLATADAAAALAEAGRPGVSATWPTLSAVARAAGRRLALREAERAPPLRPYYARPPDAAPPREGPAPRLDPT